MSSPEGLAGDSRAGSSSAEGLPQGLAVDLLRGSERFMNAKHELLAAIQDASHGIRGIRPGTEAGSTAFSQILTAFQSNRGRDLHLPYLASGLGAGPYVELVDGSVKLDLISAIGVNFFGHSHPRIMAKMIDSVSADLMQGNLQPGVEAHRLLQAILARVGSGSRLNRGWITTCGTMANEFALKLIRQKKAPATKILAFENCFAGRSTAMQEVTDSPGYRQGQPIYGEVHYAPFYDPALGLDVSVSRTLHRMKAELERFPGRFAALMIEPVQGEGGFIHAPREWYLQIFEEARKHGLAIWFDEIQTFGRTGELFAYQTLGLSEYPDVVTAAKLLQSSVLLFNESFNPKPGLIAGTFAGSTAAIAAASTVLELLDEGGFLGAGGRIAQLSNLFAGELTRLSEGSCRGVIGERRILGGMIAFKIGGGTLDETKAFLERLYSLGAIAFYCGHGPYFVRLLPPLGCMTEDDVLTAVELIESAAKGGPHL